MGWGWGSILVCSITGLTRNDQTQGGQATQGGSFGKFYPQKTFYKEKEKKKNPRVDKYLNFASLRIHDQRVIIYERQAQSFDVRG